MKIKFKKEQIDYDDTNSFTESVLGYYDINFLEEDGSYIITGDSSELDAYILPHFNTSTDEGEILEAD
jgi:hypothetical protein